MLWRTVALAALALGCTRTAGTQPRPFPGGPEEPRRIFYEAAHRLDNDTSRARVDVLYRIDRDFFVSFRNPDSSLNAPFRRHGELVVELLDSLDISRAREIRRIDLTEAAAGPSAAPRWVAGVATLHIQPGKYRIVVELEDLESERRFLERNRMIDVRTAPSDTLPDSDPILLAGLPAAGSPDCVPQNFGGDAEFGITGALAVELYGTVPDTTRWRLTLTTPPGSRTEEEPRVVLDTTATPLLFPGTLQIQEIPGGETVHYAITPGTVPATTLLLPLPLEKLPLRSYLLHAQMFRNGVPLNVTMHFRNVWPAMPLSMRDVDMALDALRYVTTPDLLDSLQHGSFETRRDNLEAFWKPRDPNPETAYNEVMTEYYRRVDYTQRTFGSMREPDGFKTDRGRIYILHGPPSRIERTLDPRTGYTEVWTYDSSRKTFVFVDQNKSGTYVLVPSKHP